MSRPRAADDFAAIRARMAELRRERTEAARGHAAEPVDETDCYPRSRSSEVVGPDHLRALLKRRGLLIPVRGRAGK